MHELPRPVTWTIPSIWEEFASRKRLAFKQLP